MREDKVEGDGATPAGEFPLRRIYFRNDRLVLPPVGLPARPISRHDGWCDDPRTDTYNRLVRIPNDWSHEKMWRDDGLYDLVVVVGYNDDPPEGEWGSAIFLHVAREDMAATKGCVAFTRADLLELLPLITRDTKLRVLSHPGQRAAAAVRGRGAGKRLRGLRREGVVVVPVVPTTKLSSLATLGMTALLDCQPTIRPMVRAV